ncbi:MAG: hypothetical protein A2350_15220 [Candidatus Raymondbacteria bacterium RifOxyB12_full_50_8]|nr:MAG: hypothetical protein A2350_15220 [Candidatus Raymondbacteria bacterium RifOxyB12_full_50_8]
MIENGIIINGIKYPFESGETILAVAQRNSIAIPTLCHLKGTIPTGACRLCVVEVEKARSLVPACSMPAAKDMVVKTESPRVVKSRKATLELLLSSGNHNCASRSVDAKEWTALQTSAAAYDAGGDLCAVYGACKLQHYAYRYQVKSSRFKGSKPRYAAEYANPFIIRDFSRCILCGRCVQACNEQQVNNAISLGYRGKSAKVVTAGDLSLAGSDCVFCGECVQACPVGALVEKKARYHARPWETAMVRTVCHFCGVGCGLVLHVKGGKIVKVTGDESAKPNQGSLCMRGRFAYDFIHSANRLAKPLVREANGYREASWSEALELVGRKIMNVRDQHGPDAIACVVSPRHTNEDFFLLQKFFRTLVGTNAINQSEHAAFSGSLMANSFREIEEARLCIVIGGRIGEDNPVATAFVKRGTLRGSQLILIDADTPKLASFAALHLKPCIGTEDIIISALIGAISADKAGAVTGVSSADIESAKALIAQQGPALVVYDGAAVQSLETFENIKKLGNGNINSFSGNNNTLGACLMGALPDYYPGFLEIAPSPGKNQFERLWDCGLTNAKGPNLEKVAEACGTGKIKMLFCVGENTLLQGMEQATVDYTVAFSLFKGVDADMVLPLAAWSEYDGTTISSRRQVNMVRTAAPVFGQAKPVWEIFSLLARHMGASWNHESARDIWEQEILATVPELTGLTYESLEKGGREYALIPDHRYPDIIHKAWRSGEYHSKKLCEEGVGVGLVTPAPNASDTRERLKEFLAAGHLDGKKKDLDAILSAYRGKTGGLIPVLQKAQEVIGYLPLPVQSYIALGLNLPASDVFGIVSFYSFFSMKPRGKNQIKVCMGTACFVMGAQEIVKEFEERLGISVGGVTPDRQFSLEMVRCLGMCGLAPAVMINNDVHAKLTPAKTAQLLEQYRRAQ